MTFNCQSGFVLGAVLLLTVVSGFTGKPGPEKTAVYKIQGAFCSACVPALTGVVENIQGVHGVEVRSDDRVVRVVYDSDEVAAETILQVTNDETNFRLALEDVESAGSEEEADSSDG